MLNRCPNCEVEINNDLVEEGLCNHCGQEFIPVPFLAENNDNEIKSGDGAEKIGSMGERKVLS